MQFNQENPPILQLFTTKPTRIDTHSFPVMTIHKFLQYFFFVCLTFQSHHERKNYFKSFQHFTTIQSLATMMQHWVITHRHHSKLLATSVDCEKNLEKLQFQSFASMFDSSSRQLRAATCYLSHHIYPCVAVVAEMSIYYTRSPYRP